MSDSQSLVTKLNDHTESIRLKALSELMEKIKTGELEKPIVGDDVNNHIHTTYSFSPYSPTKALWMAYNAGLSTAGIMDHDSIGGAREFIKAGEIIGMATTIGLECRVDMSRSQFKNRRINNPDQDSVAYMALHGIPHTALTELADFFKPLTEKRNNRNKQMIRKINEIVGEFGISMDFENDVKVLSQYNNGGSVTERHISLALAKKLIGLCGKGEKLVSFLKNKLLLQLNTKTENFLLDSMNVNYEYDLLGCIKSDYIGQFYIPATDECPDVLDALELSKRIGVISAYAYLGDVSDSVTGDKKTQKFEDAFLDDLFSYLKKVGFNAITYMPSRNSTDQLNRIKALCDTNDFFQISGEDINSPRQSFVCQAMKSPEFKNLKDSTWALIGHELAATENKSDGMFSDETIKKFPKLSERIQVYKEIGLKKSQRGQNL